MLNTPDKIMVGNKTTCLIKVDDDCDVIRPITANIQILKILSGMVVKPDKRGNMPSK